MDRTKSPAKGCNGELVSRLFDLLYQRAWLSKYDPRSSKLYTEFRRRALMLVRELSHTELSEADDVECRRMGILANELIEDVRALVADRSISDDQAAEALVLLNHILEHAAHAAIEK